MTSLRYPRWEVQAPGSGALCHQLMPRLSHCSPLGVSRAGLVWVHVSRRDRGLSFCRDLTVVTYTVGVGYNEPAMRRNTSIPAASRREIFHTFGFLLSLPLVPDAKVG